jgi:hypothetical protein
MTIFTYILFYTLMIIIVFLIDYLLVNSNSINNYDDKIKLWFKKILKK